MVVQPISIKFPNTIKYKNWWKNMDWKDNGQIGSIIPIQKSNVEIFKNEKDKSFHQVIYPVLFLAQMFALLPVYGIRGKTANDLNFKLFSVKCFYSLFITLSIITFISITIIWFFDNRIGLDKLGNTFLQIIIIFFF